MRQAPTGFFSLIGAHPSGIWRDKLRARATGEFRKPKKGEWLLSGSIVEAYQALDDMHSEYWIAEIVQVRLVTSYEVLAVLKEETS